jgi:5'-3' exonuclease
MGGDSLNLIVDIETILYPALMRGTVVVEGANGPETFLADVTGAVDHTLQVVRDAGRRAGEALNIPNRPVSTYLCWGSPQNYRKRLHKDYKANRPKEKPLGYADCVRRIQSRRFDDDMLSENLHNTSIKRLEGDDVAGILATTPHMVMSGPRVIVSGDKDLLQVPGYHVKPISGDVVLVSKEAGFRMHMLQTLTGDSSDNYKGCPGIGEVRANKILDLCETPKQMWAAVVMAYADKLLGRREALLQARLARILTGELYDFDHINTLKGIIQWSPKAL